MFIVCKAFLKKTTHLVFCHSDTRAVTADALDSPLGEQLPNVVLKTAARVPAQGCSLPAAGRRWAGSKPLPWKCLDRVLLD